jgi:cysteinyl-tRNA synthetase
MKKSLSVKLIKKLRTILRNGPKSTSNEIVFNKNFEENIHIEATNLLYEIGCVLGFFKNISQRLSNKLDDMTNELILLLIDIRNQAKNEKCFAISDKIRDELKKNNIELRDTPSGTEWTLIKT